ncbi:DUF1413 domain-containing protein [Acetobacterium carbinolicum]|uniref:DUF1413 domain-containing protein n=1 Tax=Acetobacterium carbinolicum TaxID=52690 RepID=UPI0039C9D7DF
MSTTVKFTISDENYGDLCKRAAALKLSIQDYIRRELFEEYNTITPMEAVNKAMSNYSKGDTFTVPEIFGEAWDLPNGVAGQFGKKFFALVESEYSTKIRFTGNYNSKKHAIYEIL